MFLYTLINCLRFAWIINDVEIDEYFWLHRHISWFRRIWCIDLISLRIQSFSSLIAKLFKSHSRIHRSRESMMSVTKITRFFQLFWSFLNRSIFTLFEKFEMSSTRYRKIYELRLICDLMINSNRVSSRSVSIFQKWDVIIVKSIVFIIIRFFYVMIFLNIVNVKLCFFIIFKYLFVVTCCVDLDELFQKK